MAAIAVIRAYGNNLVAIREDGTTRTFAPTPAGTWVPITGTGVETGAGGEGPTVPADGTPGTITAPVDDYPWKRAPVDAMSPLRYSYRDCTDFCAWRINRELGVTAAPWMYTWGSLRIVNGDAIGWKHDWELHGWNVSTTPSPGMLAWWGSSVGQYGHVAHVQAVGTGGVLHLEEYNWGTARQRYHERDVTPGAGYPEAFLAIPPPR